MIYICSTLSCDNKLCQSSASDKSQTITCWVCVEAAEVDDSSSSSPFTCFIAVVTSIFNSSKDACQTGLSDSLFPEENHLVHLGLCFAAGGDHRVGGVGRTAASVLVIRGVRGAAQKVGQLVRLAGLWHRCAQVPVIYRHAPPVKVGQIHGERHASSPLIHIPQFVTLIQSHCACIEDLWNKMACVNIILWQVKL